MAGTRRLEVEIIGDASSLQRALAKSTKDTSSFGSHVSKIGSAAGKAFRIAGASVAAGGVIAAIGLKKSLDAAGDFEQAMNVMRATSGATAKQMKAVSATAIKLGNDAKLPATSAKDAADAMVELAKGGFTANQAMHAARGTLLLATAAQISTTEAADILADSIHAFGLQAKDAARITDLFAGSANATTASMPEMAQALKQVGASAHQLHVPIEDTVTALGELANAGIKGSDAGTSLKTMLQFLQPKSKQAAGAIKDLGVHAFNSAGQFVGLRNLTGQYHDALVKLNPQQRQQAINTIFGSDASRAANIVLGASVAHYDKLREQITKTGSAQRLAGAQTQGYKGAWAALSNTLETFQLQLGMKLLPIATQFLRTVNANFPAAAATIGRALGNVGRAVSDVAAEVRKHWGDIQKAAQGVAAWYATNLKPTMIATLNAMRTAWQKWGTDVTRIVTADFKTIRAAVNTNLALLRGDWSTAFANLRPTVSNAFDAVIGLMKLKDKVLQAIGQSIAQNIIHSVQSGLARLPGVANQQFAALADAITGMGPRLIAATRELGVAMVEGVAAGIRSAPADVAGALGGVVSGAVAHAKSILHIHSPSQVTRDELGVPFMQGFIQGITSQQGDIYQAIGDTVRQAVQDAKQNLSAIGGDLASSVAQGIDANARKKLSDLDQSPDARRLRGIQAQIAGQQTARDRQRLQDALDQATSPEERKQAQQDLDDWLLQQEADTLQASLDQRQQAIEDEADSRKTAFQQGLDDLNDALNRGLVSQIDYNAQLQVLLTNSGVNYENIGAALGSAFANGYLAQIAALKAQADAILTGPQAAGAGQGIDIVSPASAVSAGLAEIRSAKQAAIALTAAQRAAIRGSLAELGAGFASGGITPRTGLFLVGEKGPELAALPGGTRITPADQTSKRLGGVTIENMNFYGTSVDPDLAMRRASKRLRMAVSA